MGLRMLCPPALETGIFCPCTACLQWLQEIKAGQGGASLPAAWGPLPGGQSWNIQGVEALSYKLQSLSVPRTMFRSLRNSQKSF